MSMTNHLRVGALLFFPALLAGSDFAFNSPSDGSTVTVTANQSLPVQMTIRNTTTGAASLVPVNYTAQTTVTLTCPPAANPCSTYLISTGAVPPFILYGSQSFAGAITVINFQNAPTGFYTVKVAIAVQACTDSLTCAAPETFFGNIQFTAQVVSAMGAATNVLPHFAVGGGFITDITVINNGGQAAQFSLDFYNDGGTPASLPFTGLGTINTLSDSVPAFGSATYEAGDPNAAVQGGWAMIKADPSITIQVLFRSRGSNGSYYEAAVPAYAGSHGVRIPFDATRFPPTGEPLYTGFALVNLDPQRSANIACTARDFRGNIIPNAVGVPTLGPLGHWANYLFPVLTGARGTIECTSNNLIAGIGLRFIGTNGFSSLPVVVE
jgi:hypothetical protein